MEDENRLRDVDRRVIAALDPDEAVVRRVVHGAIARGFEHRAGRARPVRRIAAAFAVVAAISVAGAAWYARKDSQPPATKPSLTITGNGSSIVVESSDGRRWFVGGEPARHTSGSYVIVVPNHGEVK